MIQRPIDTRYINDPSIKAPMDRIKEILDQITGQKVNKPKLEHVDSGASLSDLITAFNDLLDRIQN